MIVILDRDGVINHDSPDFIKSPDEWIPINGSMEAIALFTQHGYQVYVATNQSGVGRGIINEDLLGEIHQKMLSMIQDAGGALAGIVYCPHHPNKNCQCRKPRPGLLHRIERMSGVAITGQPFVGDSPRDIQTAQAVNCEPVLVLTGNGQSTHIRHPDIPAFKDLLTYAEYKLSL